jgi:glycosyltransferase involved in cell wall biosynthesis
MTALKIALLHYSVPPVVGGVESVIAYHARLMDAAGHHVRLVAGRGEALATGSRNSPIPLIQVPLLDSKHPDILALRAELNAGRTPPEFEAAVDQIAGELRRALEGVDLLIPHNVCSLNKNLALTAALRRLAEAGAPPRMILWHHDLAWATPRYLPELHDGYPWDLLRSDWPETRPVVVSETRRYELATLLRVPLDRITVVPNGVETAHLHKLEPQTQRLSQAMCLAEAEPLLLLPVRLTPRKNIEFALHVLAELRRLMPRAALLVTGPEGPHNPANADYRRALLETRDQLGLRGAAHFAAEHSGEFLPDAVVGDFFHMADALFLPSREEGFGIPLIEAALTRLPIFCSDISPLRELAREEATYFSLDAEPASIAAMVHERLAQDRQYRFAARARRVYSWDGIYKKYIEPLLSA